MKNLAKREQRFDDGLHIEEEELGIEKFIELTKHFPKIFAQTARTEDGAFIDVACTDYTGGTFAVENKVRKGYAHDRFATTFIEDDKYANEKCLWKHYNIPTLFINYWKDGHIYIFDIARMTDKGVFSGFPCEWVENIEYRNPKDNKHYYKSGYRILIPNKYAIHLDENFNILNKKEYKEIFDGDGKVERKTNLFDFDDLSMDTINEMTEWKTSNRR